MQSSLFAHTRWWLLHHNSHKCSDDKRSWLLADCGNAPILAEHKPWDNTMGYPTVLGVTRVTDLTLANWGGTTACPGDASGVGTQQRFSFGNHPVAPDAFHPHFFSKVRTPGELVRQGMELGAM